MKITPLDKVNTGNLRVKELRYTTPEENKRYAIPATPVIVFTNGYVMFLSSTKQGILGFQMEKNAKDSASSN